MIQTSLVHLKRTLRAERNVILGGESDDDEGEDVVFEVAVPPSGDEAIRSCENNVIW